MDYLHNNEQYQIDSRIKEFLCLGCETSNLVRSNTRPTENASFVYIAFRDRDNDQWFSLYNSYGSSTHTKDAFQFIYKNLKEWNQQP